MKILPPPINIHRTDEQIYEITGYHQEKEIATMIRIGCIYVKGESVEKTHKRKKSIENKRKERYKSNETRYFLPFVNQLIKVEDVYGTRKWIENIETKGYGHKQRTTHEKNPAGKQIYAQLKKQQQEVIE